MSVVNKECHIPNKNFSRFVSGIFVFGAEAEVTAVGGKGRANEPRHQAAYLLTFGSASFSKTLFSVSVHFPSNALYFGSFNTADDMNGLAGWYDLGSIEIKLLPMKLVIPTKAPPLEESC